MNIKIGTCSKIGDKKVNEDYKEFVIVGKTLIALVADGMGSHGKGDEAAKIAVESIKQYIIENIDNINNITIDKAFNKANKDIISKQSKESEMKTTMCMAIYKSSKLYFAHLGDSRIYFFGNDEIKYLSRDHSVARLQYDIGEIKYDEIRGHIDRNRVTRALGASDDCVKPIIKIFEDIELEDNMGVLLCTDGFWEEIIEEQMISELSKSQSAEDWLENMINIVDNSPNEDKDNITAITMRFFK